jgi:RimJ/RimL family protein N-acetyltransferase
VLLRNRRLLVYGLADRLNGEVLLPTDIKWTQATRDSIAGLFRDDPRRKKTFLQFVNRGYYGIIMYHDSQWVSYGWMSKPDTLGPPHLPLGIQKSSAYWLFYQHTSQDYRGCGVYKCSLQLQAAQALGEVEHTQIYVDTRPDNIASRKGILAVGFQPKGIIDTRELRIPRVKSWVWGSWDMDAGHPGLDGGTAS